MTKDRFVEVQAHLSFELPGSMRYPTDPFRKLRYVDKALLLAATWAWDPEPFACLDESRVATHSQYCPFRQQMMCKPIKDGCTVYTFVFESGYLYAWEWFLGAAADTPLPLGQPTDTAPLDEDNSGFIVNIVKTLAGRPEFHGTGMTVVTDKGYTSITAAMYLASCGIFLVGMLRTKGRPVSTPRGARHYFPFRFPTMDNLVGWARGARREAYQQLQDAHGREWYLKAEVWLDSRFCTLIGTVIFEVSDVQVRRWSKTSKAYILIACSRMAKLYQKHMPHVDRYNDRHQSTNISMGYCRQRYTRALFIGFHLAMLVCNTVTIVCWLIPAAVLGKLKRRAKNFGGILRFSQMLLAESLCDLGVWLAKQELGDADQRARSNLAPHWMSRQQQRRARPLPGLFPEVHEIKNFKTDFSTRERLRLGLPSGGRSNCAGCLLLCEEVEGSSQQTPGGHARFYLPSGLRVPEPRLGCVVCKVNLCKKCRRPVAKGGWDHVGYCHGQLPPVSG